MTVNSIKGATMARKSNVRSYHKPLGEGMMYKKPKQSGAALYPDPWVDKGTKSHSSKQKKMKGY